MRPICGTGLQRYFVLVVGVVSTERRRPHVAPFAAHPLTDGTNLIPRNALLDAMEDDDDIEWPEDPFES